MRAHICDDVESGLVHHVHDTAANVTDVTQVAELLHGEESAVYADAGYTGIKKREENENREVIWQIAARRSTYSKLNKRSVLYKAEHKIECCKAQARAKVEHPFRVIKWQFGYVKVRFRGLMKNTAQLTTLVALSSLWMVQNSSWVWVKLALNTENRPKKTSAHDLSVIFRQLIVHVSAKLQLTAAARQVDRSILSAVATKARIMSLQ